MSGELKGACIFGQSGGPTAVINASAYGVLKTALESDAITNVYGAAHGIRGVLDDRLYDIAQEDPDELRLLLHTPSSELGSCRYKMADPDTDDTDYRRILEIFRKYNVRYFFYNGGNDSMDTCNKINTYMQSVGYECRVMGVPKTIDNDIWGTDVTFGFHTAVDIATEVIDRIHTTAASHGRCMVIELMGNKAGWLTLYSGIAGGADIILLPEIPYDINVVADAVRRRAENGKAFSIVAVAEGAMSVEEAAMKKKERAVFREETGFTGIANRIAKQLEEMVGVEARAVVPGHVQRGGSPSAYDRMLSTVFGVHAAQLIAAENYGQAVAMVGNTVSHNPLSEVAGKTKFVPADAQAVRAARSMGISLGD